MLKYRLLTALILIPVLLVFIWFLPMPWFSVVAALIIGWGAWEWAAFVKLTQTPHRIAYVCVIMAMLIIAYYLSVRWILAIAVLAWIWACAAIIFYQRDKKPLGFQCRWAVATMGVLALIPCWLSINILREDIGGPAWLLYGLVIVWVMDSGAYFCGKLWGKRQFISHVSPNKTWEGFVGGLISVFVFAFVVCLAFRVPFYRLIAICGLSIVTALFATVGDLLESLLKRQIGVKDSGVGLPGHGGILDRIDSVLAALPVFTLGSLLLSNFL